MAEVMKKEKMKFVRIWGKSKNKIEDLRKFTSDPKVRFMLANWRSAGTGGNFQVANYVIFLESPYSPLERSQAEKRVRPRLQKRTFIYDVVMRGSVDVKLLQYLKEGKDLFQALIRGQVSMREALTSAR